MSCRNPNVRDYMANDTRKFTEIFSNENSNDSGYWSDYPEVPKQNEKNDYPSETLCNACYQDRQKNECFFFKYEWSSNQLKCNFKSIYVQILPFFQFHFTLVGRIRKTVRTKNYILKTNLTFHSQIFSGRFDQNQDCRCLSLPFWVYHCFDCMHRMFYCSNKPIVFHSIQFWRNQVFDYQTSYVSHNKHVIRF